MCRSEDMKCQYGLRSEDMKITFKRFAYSTLTTSCSLQLSMGENVIMDKTLQSFKRSMLNSIFLEINSITREPILMFVIRTIIIYNVVKSSVTSSHFTPLLSNTCSAPCEYRMYMRTRCELRRARVLAKFDSEFRSRGWKMSCTMSNGSFISNTISNA